jgi:hemoglobin
MVFVSPEVQVMVGRILAAAMLLLAISAISRADDRPLDRLELDRRIVKSVYETALEGTKLFNGGKPEECFRLYQGALIGLQPLLDHRPNLMKSVRDKMDKAAGLKPIDGACVLREALDEIQNEIAPGAKPEPKTDSKKEPLWDRLGGEKKVRSIVKDFLKTVEADKAVNFFRDGKVKLDAKGEARMEQLFVELVSLFTGGPLEYSDKRTLLDVHKGMKITDAEFDAMLADLRKTLEQHKVGKAESEELLKHFAATRTVIVEAKEKGM